MRNLYLKSLLSAVLVATATGTSFASELPSCFKSEPLSRMRKAPARHQWNTPEKIGKQKRVSPSYTTPQSDSFQYLFGPDGSEWFAMGSYDYEYVELEGGYAVDALIKGYEFKIYDSKFNEVGTVKDKVTFEEGEIRCASVMLDVTVSKKFFNVNDKCEVMVALCMNTPDYTVNTRTNVYTIGGDKDGEYDVPVATIPGYPVDAVNTAQDPWSEDFFITFLTEKYPEKDVSEYQKYTDYLADFYQVLTTYTEAGLNEGAKVLTTREVPMLNLPGDQMSSPMMLCKDVDGAFTVIYAQYEKSLFIDPSGMGGNEALTPDNSLLIDVYQLDNGYPKQLQHICSTKIDTPQKEDQPDVYYTFYGIGTLLYDDDVDFTHYSSDGKPSFIITVDDYLLSDDDTYNSSYYVYDADGNRKLTLAENTFDFVIQSDIPGFERQAMFVHTGDEMLFEFVDLYSGESRFELDQMYRGFPLSTSIDRTMTADGYAYAIAVSQGEPDDDGNLQAPVCWFDMEGNLIRTDLIPLGENIELAQVYISNNALSPYVFNTDSELEYMLLVKRRVNNYDEGLREELLIATVADGAINTFLPENGKGVLSTVYIANNERPQLIIVYNDDYRFTADAYDLPFTMFAGGDGSAANPYEIATAGDLMQIATNPAASYLITADIDCGGVTLKSVENFTGKLDGDGHTISNLSMRGNKKVAMFGTSTNADFRNINFHNCSMELSGSGDVAILTSTAGECTFSNIHVRNLKVTGDSFSGIFGGIAGKSWTRTSFTECEVAGADINLPNCQSAGGIVGDIRTGTTIQACAFSGSITADNTLGGIVGTTTTGDERISGCHIDADLKACNTVGGIVGFLDRSKVTGNYVEGTIEVTKPNKWTNALSAGAIAGELEGDWQGKSDVPVAANLIGVSSITYPKLDIVESYPHQLATVHRIVGRSCYNVEPEIIGYDENDNPIYKNEARYEEGIYNNIVVSDLACIDSDFAEKTLEGTTVAKEDVDVEMLQNTLGFSYGTSADSPWNIMSWYAYDPSLYYESMVYIPYSSKSVAKGDTFFLDVALVSREELSEDDVIGGLMCEFNESLLEMTEEMEYDGKLLRLGFTALEEGSCPVSVSVLGSFAGCNIEIVNGSGSVGSIEASTKLPQFADGFVIAEGCSIAIYSLDGKMQAAGHDRLGYLGFERGVYVVTATDANGNTVSVKIMR